MSKKVNETIQVFSKEENSKRQVKEFSSTFNAHYGGTGAHKSRKYDKKLRREEGKKACREY